MTPTTLDIILVDDNRRDVELTLDVFREYDLSHRVVVLHDGQEALDYIFRTGTYIDRGACCEQPVVILLDINTRKVSGIEVLRRIRADERTKTIPVVALTSSQIDIDKDRMEGYKLGVNSYIVKPIESEDLSRAMAAIGYYWAVLNKPALQEEAILSPNNTRQADYIEYYL